MICLPADGSPAYQVASAELCTGLVAMQPQDVPPNPLYLTTEEGAVISSAVLGVWLVAWAFKQLMRSLNTDGATEKES